MPNDIQLARPVVSARHVAPAAPKMSIRNLDFYYGKFHALKDVSLDVGEKRVTAFIGPSGCGKSTLLRVLNRMYSLYPGQRATGEVMFNGRNLLGTGVDLNMLRAKVGMVYLQRGVRWIPDYRVDIDGAGHARPLPRLQAARVSGTER